MRRKRIARLTPGTFDSLEARPLLSTLVALIDSGIDLTSTADTPYYDFTYGYDAYNKQTVAQYGTQVVQDTSLQHGHGASVADFIIKGIQDATSQPGAGSTDVKIMPIRDTSGGLNIDSNALIRGVYWAADHGASVINLSVNYNHDPVLDDPADPHDGAYLSQAIQYAETKGAVVVTGPGNSQTNIDQTVVFPPYADDAFYTDASPTPGNLLVAAAVDASGNLTSVSNWGPVHVDLGAYTSAAGATSYSSGYTAGVAGVIADMLPPGHTAADVVGIIKGTVTPHAQSVGAWSTTGGVINPAGAVAEVISRGVSLRAGGGPVGTYGADAYYRGGTAYSTSAAIDTGGLPGPAPQAVYQSRTVRQFHLHPAPPPARQSLRRAAGFRGDLLGRPQPEAVQRRDQRQPGPDQLRHLRRGGGKDIGLTREFPATADASGRIVLQFTSIRDYAKVSGISVTPAPDLALGKPAVSSTVEGPGYAPAMAVDGNSSTRWSSGQWMQSTGTGWIYVDLGAPYNVSEVRLNWEAAYAVDYQVQLSDDAVHWVAVKSVAGNQADGRPGPRRPRRRGPLRPHLLHPDQRRFRQLLPPRLPGLRHPGHRPGTREARVRLDGRECLLRAGDGGRRRTARPAGPAASGCRAPAPAGSTSTSAPVQRLGGPPQLGGRLRRRLPGPALRRRRPLGRRQDRRRQPGRRASRTSPASPEKAATSASTAPGPAPVPTTTPSATSRSSAPRLTFPPLQPAGTLSTLGSTRDADKCGDLHDASDGYPGGYSDPARQPGRAEPWFAASPDSPRHRAPQTAEASEPNSGSTLDQGHHPSDFLNRGSILIPGCLRGEDCPA